MSALDELRLLGYTVEVDDEACAVRGFGVAISFAIADADELLQALADPAAHAERVRQSDPDYTAPAPAPASSSPPVTVADVRELLAAAVPNLDLAALDAAIATVETPAKEASS